MKVTLNQPHKVIQTLTKIIIELKNLIKSELQLKKENYTKQKKFK